MPSSPRSSSATRRLAAGLAALLLLGGLAGCGGRDSPASSPPDRRSGSGVVAGSGANASCAAAIRYGGHLYLMSGHPDRTPEATGRTLPAVRPGCNDMGPNGPQDPDRPVRVDVLRATDPQVAVGYLGAVYVREGTAPRPGDR